ncbi:unnamed protein product [Rhizophagus irregularis]|nr:unnamed protein product [Rhizophagus irregularis]
MPPPSKQKRKSKEQPRTADGKYNIKKTCNDSRDSLMLEVSYNDDDSSDFIDDGSCYFNDDPDSFNDNEAWGDDDDSGWDEPEDMEAEIKLHQRLKGLDLDLKEQLEKQHNQLTVVEYNYKRAIFEYLTLLNNNNGHGRIDISLEVARKIFIDGGVWKARKIQNLTKYWLLNNKLPESKIGNIKK